MQTMILNAKLNNNWLLVSILTFGVFSILSTELGAMGLMPILQTHFNVSVASASWAVSIFALMITICAPVVLIQASIFGFYGYLSDFLHKITALNFTQISLILAAYGATNILGNLFAGKALSANANKALMLSTIFLALLYILIFTEAQNALFLSIIILILGILAGLMNNGVHFMITQPFPKQAEFTNGIFLSVANIG